MNNNLLMKSSRLFKDRARNFFSAGGEIRICIIQFPGYSGSKKPRAVFLFQVPYPPSDIFCISFGPAGFT